MHIALTLCSFENTGERRKILSCQWSVLSMVCLVNGLLILALRCEGIKINICLTHLTNIYSFLSK